jgi:pyruvate/oxaloacetate carboxyltransferase
MTVTAVTVYTVSPVHTDEYYAERIRELLALGVDRVGVKDPTGCLHRSARRRCSPVVMRAAGDTKVELHSHCQSSLAPEVYSEAIKAGFHYAHTAVMPLANGASLPAVEDIVERAAALGVETSLDMKTIAEISGYFSWLCVREGSRADAWLPTIQRSTRTRCRRDDLEPEVAAADDEYGTSASRNSRRKSAACARTSATRFS